MRKEESIDWSKVKVDTPILVSTDGKTWFNRYFAEYKDGEVFFWNNGATSWSSKHVFKSWCIVTFPYAKLANDRIEEEI